MNLSLVDPFVLAQDYPESLSAHLREFIGKRNESRVYQS